MFACSGAFHPPSFVSAHMCASGSFQPIAAVSPSAGSATAWAGGSETPPCAFFVHSIGADRDMHHAVGFHAKLCPLDLDSVRLDAQRRDLAAARRTKKTATLSPRISAGIVSTARVRPKVGVSSKSQTSDDAVIAGRPVAIVGPACRLSASAGGEYRDRPAAIRPLVLGAARDEQVGAADDSACRLHVVRTGLQRRRRALRAVRA